MKRAGYAFVLLLACAVLLELMAWGWFRFEARDSLTTRRSGAYWSDVEHGAIAAQRLRLVAPHVLHLAPYRGAGVIIGDDGLRRTTGSDCSRGTAGVVFFGGSMMWGHGVPDDETIPSLVAHEIRRGNEMPCVENRAEWGETTRSALFELRQLEESGRAPAVAVFYIGSYDVKDVLLGGELGENIVVRTAGRGALLERSHLLRLFHRWSGRHDAESVASDVVERVRDQMREARRIVNQPREARGIVNGKTRLLFVLHPYVLVGGKPLTRAELRAARAATLELPALKAALRSTYAQLSAAHDPLLIDLSHLFDGDAAERFIDAGHLNAGGNLLIARSIAALLR